MLYCVLLVVSRPDIMFCGSYYTVPRILLLGISLATQNLNDLGLKFICMLPYLLCHGIRQLNYPIGICFRFMWHGSLQAAGVQSGPRIALSAQALRRKTDAAPGCGAGLFRVQPSRVNLTLPLQGQRNHHRRGWLYEIIDESP